MSLDEPILMQEIDKDTYRSAQGHSLKREDGVDVGGNAYQGKWVYRTPDGVLVDFDRYRYDLAGRYKMQLLHLDTPTAKRRNARTRKVRT